MHHRLSSQMYRSSPGFKVSVSWNRIVDAMIEFSSGDLAKLASSMCMKLIAEYVGLLRSIALALCLIKPSASVPVPAASQPREVKALFRRSLRRKTVNGSQV